MAMHQRGNECLGHFPRFYRLLGSQAILGHRNLNADGFLYYFLWCHIFREECLY